MPSRHRRGFPRGRMPSPGLRGINPAFAGLSPCGGQVAYVLRTRAPVAASVLLHRAAPRLACVRPAASVHPEPGSNSSLYSNSSRGCPPARRAGGHYPSCGAPPRRAPYAVPVPSMISLLCAPGVSPESGCKGTHFFPLPPNFSTSFFIQDVTFFVTHCESEGRGDAFWDGRGCPAGDRGVSCTPEGGSGARRPPEGGAEAWLSARMAGFCGGRRRGKGAEGLRQASLRDSARARVFNLYLELGCGGGDGLSNDATD